MSSQASVETHTPGAGGERKTAWISRGFEELLYEKKSHYDVVIVGSGYGGAIAAAELSGWIDKEGGKPRPITVCVLERGREYLPGMFPSRMADLAGHVRFSTPNSSKPRGLREGLFDVRVGPDLCALLANGLGGGSLINAGVMAEPGEEIFGNTSWPMEFRDPSQRAGKYRDARKALGMDDEMNWKINGHPKGEPTKFKVLKDLAGNKPFEAASITVAMKDKDNAAGVALKECKLCGDCATGCNHGAKNSLDMNLLATAWCYGAEIYTGATVLRIERDESSQERDESPAERDLRPQGWTLTVVHTDELLRKREREPLELKAGVVILAAGTFGSTEILLRSQSERLRFSPRLGQRVSSNGDMIAVAYKQNCEVNAVADESSSPDGRGIGPTITGMIGRSSNSGFVIEELAIPGPLRRAFEEVVATSHALHMLEKRDPSEHKREDPGPDSCAVDRHALRNTSVFAIMGNDRARGSLELIGGSREADGDGALRVRWPELRDQRLFEGQIDALKELVEKEKGPGGTVLPNALWQLLPEGMQEQLGFKHGPPLTVHPLGGCPMGPSALRGVVDHFGRVFDAAAPFRKDRPVHRGLIVLDGSIVPRALGINPALTIAALALHAVRGLVQELNFTDRTDRKPLPKRPIFRTVPRGGTDQPTEVELIERMSGEVTLEGKDDPAIACVVELTLGFEKCPLMDQIVLPADGKMKRTLDLHKERSMLRIFKADDWNEWHRQGEPDNWLREKPDCTDRVTVKDIVQFKAPLTGTLSFLHRESSTCWVRTLRAVRAWLFNRALRDFPDWLEKRRKITPQKGKVKRRGADDRWGYVKSICALASRAGEARLLEYELTIGDPEVDKGLFVPAALRNGEIQGRKRLTYGRRSNPWRQLSEMALCRFPELRRQRWGRLRRVFRHPRQEWPPVLGLDTRYLANEGVPLFRIVKQHDQPSALADLASLFAYFLRLLLSIHMWSFRRPDAPTPREPQRLPGIVKGLPRPLIHEIDVDQLPDGSPVRVRLTRYCRKRTQRPPVVMIHGYSASGTTFAHHAVSPNLAQHFFEKNRDVWILDLRTSSGMPTARHPWRFEDAALGDLPAAFDFICRETDKGQLDVFAHCMGAAMFSMAVLKEPVPGERFYSERKKLPYLVNRAVLSQIGPVVLMSPDNILRGYVLSYLRQYLPLEGYDLRVKPDPTLADQLLDRLLATLPYPEEEFDVENPPWRPWRFWRFRQPTPFVGTRHRMDALYGRDFRLARGGKTLLSKEALEYIDDLFGPLSLETVSQGIHLARMGVIATREGRNEYVWRANLKKRWRFPTLSIHGENNGLSDVATLARMERVLENAGCKIEVRPFDSFGHQDSLIGKEAKEVFRAVSEFFERRAPVSDMPGNPTHASAASNPVPPEAPRFKELPGSPRFKAELPWIGPILGPPKEGSAFPPVSVGVNPRFGKAYRIAFVAVKRKNERFDSVGLPSFENVEDADSWCTVPGDASVWSSLSDRLQSEAQEIDGVLVALLYDTSPDIGEGASTDESDRQGMKDAIELLLQEKFAPSPEEVASGIDPGPWLGVIEAKDLPLGQGAQKPVEPQLAGDPKPTVTFALASCQYPAGILDRKVAESSYRRLASRLYRPGVDGKPQFLLLVGDQVYVDATAGFFDPAAQFDRYVAPYNNLFLMIAVKDVLRRLPAYTMLDDHEIEENWEPLAWQMKRDPMMDLGCKSYWKYQRSGGPGCVDPRGGPKGPLWYPIKGSIPFFMADTRSERLPRTAATIDNARIMSDDQFNELLAWLSAQKSDIPKFVASPSILLPRHLEAIQDPASALRSDSWDGYPGSLHRLLAYIAEREIKNLVFLSGDEHVSSVTRATITSKKRGSASIVSVHSSALYAPYPFANGAQEDFTTFGKEEKFGFWLPDEPANGDTLQWGGDYTCKVGETEFFPGDGFAVLQALLENGKWKLRCEFDREDGRQLGEYEL